MIQDLVPIFTAIIALMSILSFLLVGVNALLSTKIEPLKKDIKRLEDGQKALENGLKALDSKMDKVIMSLNSKS